MPLKKNPDQYYTSNTPGGMVLDTKAIVTTVLTSMVVGGLFGVVTYSRITDSNTFRINSTAEALEDLQQNVITKEVYQANQQTIENKIDTVSKQVEEIKKIIQKNNS